MQGPWDAEHAVSTRGSQQRTAAAKARGEPEAGKRVREHQAKETQETRRARGGRGKTRGETRRTKNSATMTI